MKLRNKCIGTVIFKTSEQCNCIKHIIIKVIIIIKRILLINI